MPVLWIGLFIITVVLLIYILGKSSDPYGTFHLALNRRAGHEGPPRTEWLNMGYWKEATVFPEACEALALHLCDAARMVPRGRVLDVGHGSGESLLLQLSHPSIPRPRLLHGITSLSSHHHRSKERVTQLLSSQSSLEDLTEVILFEGDAIWHPSAGNHPFSPHSSQKYDTILALDCAYHFRTRSEYLRQSFDHLAPGGRVALADICFFDHPGNFTTALLAYLFRIMPRENMVSKEQYVQEMEASGYVDVALEDITQWVFPGFRAFLETQGFSWKIFAGVIGLLGAFGARFVVVAGTRPP